KADLHRAFYTEMCRAERLSVRALRDNIGGMLFERTALSREPEELARQELVKLREAGQFSPGQVFRDPYLLDSFDLADTYSEKNLEAARSCARWGDLSLNCGLGMVLLLQIVAILRL